MLERFLNEIWVYSSKFIKFDISYKQIEIVKNKVLNELNLDDFYKLRDRLDGLNFYENSISKLAPFFYLKERYDIIIPETSLKNNARGLDSCIINGEKYLVVCFKFGEFPTFKHTKDCGYLFFIRKGGRQFYYCGKLSKDAIDNKSIVNFGLLESDLEKC